MRRLFGSKRETVSFQNPKETIQSLIFDVQHQRLTLITNTNKTRVYAIDYNTVEIIVDENVLLLRDEGCIKLTKD